MAARDSAAMQTTEIKMTTDSASLQMTEIEPAIDVRVVNKEQSVSSRRKKRGITVQPTADQANNHISEMMKKFDKDKDGQFSHEEVSNIVKELELETVSRGRIQKIACALIVIILLMLCANMGLMAAVVFFAKDSQVKDSTLRDMKGLAVATRSTDMEVTDTGELRSTGASHEHVKTSEALDEYSLDSRLPDAALSELKYVYFKNANGGSIHLVIQAYARVMSEDALFGSYVHIHSAVGDIYLDGNIVEFKNDMHSMFTRAGFTVAPSGRRLQGAFDLIGLFNALPSFDAWNATYDEPPQIPTTFIAQASLMYACTYQDDAGLTTDLCDAFNIRSRNTVSHRGEKWTHTNVTMWSDAEKGLERESYYNMPLLYGWSFEKINDRSGALQHVAQTWPAANETYFCRTHENMPAIALGPLGSDVSKFLGVYLGEQTLDKEVVEAFRIKHREHANIHVDYFLKNAGAGTAADGSAVVSLLPREIIVHLTHAHDGPPGTSSSSSSGGRRYAFLFNTFDVVESVPYEAFGLGASGWDPSAAELPFAETVCAETLPYTSNTTDAAPLISERVAILGADPFMPPEEAPDSEGFFWDLQLLPQLTAALWNETLRIYEGSGSLGKEEAAPTYATSPPPRTYTLMNGTTLNDTVTIGNLTVSSAAYVEAEGLIEAQRTATEDSAETEKVRRIVENRYREDLVEYNRELLFGHVDAEGELGNASVLSVLRSGNASKQFVEMLSMTSSLLKVRCGRRMLTELEATETSSATASETRRRRAAERAQLAKRAMPGIPAFAQVFASKIRGVQPNASLYSLARSRERAGGGKVRRRLRRRAMPKADAPDAMVPLSWKERLARASTMDVGALDGHRRLDHPVNTPPCVCNTCVGNCPDLCNAPSLGFPFDDPQCNDDNCPNEVCTLEVSMPHGCGGSIVCNLGAEVTVWKIPPVNVQASGGLGWDCAAGGGGCKINEAQLSGSISVGIPNTPIDVITATITLKVTNNLVSCAEPRQYDLGPEVDYVAQLKAGYEHKLHWDPCCSVWCFATGQGGECREQREARSMYSQYSMWEESLQCNPTIAYVEAAREGAGSNSERMVEIAAQCRANADRAVEEAAAKRVAQNDHTAAGMRLKYSTTGDYRGFVPVGGYASPDGLSGWVKSATKMTTAEAALACSGQIWAGCYGFARADHHVGVYNDECQFAKDGVCQPKRYPYYAEQVSWMCSGRGRYGLDYVGTGQPLDECGAFSFCNMAVWYASDHSEGTCVQCPGGYEMMYNLQCHSMGLTSQGLTECQKKCDNQCSDSNPCPYGTFCNYQNTWYAPEKSYCEPCADYTEGQYAPTTVTNTDPTSDQFGQTTVIGTGCNTAGDLLSPQGAAECAAKCEPQGGFCYNEAGIEDTDCSDCGGCGGSETCNYSRDGDCDDGGPGAEYSICEPRTDAFDCLPGASGNGDLGDNRAEYVWWFRDNNACNYGRSVVPGMDCPPTTMPGTAGWGQTHFKIFTSPWAKLMKPTHVTPDPKEDPPSPLPPDWDEYTYGEKIWGLGLTIDVAGGILSGEAVGRMYSYDGPDEGGGYTHTATYYFDSSITDEYGVPMAPRTFTYPACKQKRSNYFPRLGAHYDITITGGIDVCMLYCISVINGWILPWGAKESGGLATA